MRRAAIVPLAVTLFVMLGATPATAARIRAYAGETSAGTKIGFRVRVGQERQMSMKGLRFDAALHCEDATTLEYSSWWSFGGVGHRLDGRRLAFDERFLYEALHVTGVFRGQTAEGAFEVTWATLTDTEEAQLCTTGNLTWTADRVPRGRWAALASTGEPDVAHQVTGTRVRSVTRAG